MTAFHIMYSRDDVTLPVHLAKWPPAKREQWLLALKRLKYLNLGISAQFIGLGRICLNNIIVLELSVWHINVSTNRLFSIKVLEVLINITQAVSEEMSTLATQFPQLHTLRLLSNFPESSAIDPPTRKKAATEAFAQCPRLKTVFLSCRPEARFAWVFSKREGIYSKDEVIKGGVTDFHCNLWWKAYIE